MDKCSHKTNLATEPLLFNLATLNSADEIATQTVFSFHCEYQQTIEQETMKRTSDYTWLNEHLRCTVARRLELWTGQLFRRTHLFHTNSSEAATLQWVASKHSLHSLRPRRRSSCLSPSHPLRQLLPAVSSLPLRPGARRSYRRWFGLLRCWSGELGGVLGGGPLAAALFGLLLSVSESRHECASGFNQYYAVHRWVKVWRGSC